MHLLLIRHGQSTNNIIEAELGDCPAFYQRRVVDPALSELGERQAAALAKHVGAQLRGCAAQRRVQMACSSMRRAMQTAEPLAAQLGIRPLVRPDCVERCAFFCINKEGEQIAQPGPTSADVLRQFPTFDASLVDSAAKPNLETAAEARRRANRVASELKQHSKSEAAPELLVLVAHADFIGLLARALLFSEQTCDEGTENAMATPIGEPYFDLNNTATVHLVLLPNGRVRMLHWNRTEHLKEALRSGIAWKNMPSGCELAAEWAKHGEGGSRLSPLFVEAETVATDACRCYTIAVAAALAGAAVAWAATKLLRA